MKCMSCAAPISPAFKSAIQNNICPACGGEIMNEGTLDLLDDLKEALEKMPNDPEGLAGWLLSNYEMRKIGECDPVGQFYGAGQMPAQGGQRPQMTPQQIQQMQLNQMRGGGGEGQPLGTNPHFQNFIPKNQRPHGSGYDASMMDREAQLRAQPKVASNKMQQFYANAGVKPKSQDKYASLAQQINGDGGEDYGNDYGGEDDYGADPYDQGGIPAEAMDPDFTQGVLGAAMANERPMSRQERADLQAMMGGIGGQGDDYGGDYGSGADYDPSLPPALNMERRSRLEKQQELSMGGKIGKISRSS